MQAVLFCATLSTVPNPVVNVSPLLPMFPYWDISACLTNTASLGDSVALFRLMIASKLVTNIPTPTLCLSLVDTVPSSTISHHINSGLNKGCFSIVCVRKTIWDLASYNRSEI